MCTWKVLLHSPARYQGTKATSANLSPLLLALLTFVFLFASALSRHFQNPDTCQPLLFLSFFLPWCRCPSPESSQMHCVEVFSSAPGQDTFVHFSWYLVSSMIPFHNYLALCPCNSGNWNAQSGMTGQPGMTPLSMGFLEPGLRAVGWLHHKAQAMTGFRAFATPMELALSCSAAPLQFKRWLMAWNY